MSQPAVTDGVDADPTAAAHPGAHDATAAVERPARQATGPDDRQPAIRPMNAPYVAPGP